MTLTESAAAAVGFEKVRITVNENSRRFIRDWTPDLDAGLYVASACIEANKPSNDDEAHLAANSSGATAPHGLGLQVVLPVVSVPTWIAAQ